MHLKKAWLYLDLPGRAKPDFQWGSHFCCFLSSSVFSPHFTFHLLKNCCFLVLYFWWGGGILPVLLAKKMFFVHKHMEILIFTKVLFLSMEDSSETYHLIWNGSKWWKSIFSNLPITSARPVFYSGKMASAVSSKNSPSSLK